MTRIEIDIYQNNDYVATQTTEFAHDPVSPTEVVDKLFAIIDAGKGFTLKCDNNTIVLLSPAAGPIKLVVS